jgi:hypothetical protein
MAVKEKILKGLKSATTHLENSMQALNKKDESLLADSLWHVAAELEYTLFLFSITFQNEKDLSKWKPNPEPKIETGPTLMDAQNLLNEAEKFIMNEKLLDAYKSAYVARHFVLKVQEDLAKKKRKMLRKKQ